MLQLCKFKMNAIFLGLLLGRLFWCFENSRYLVILLLLLLLLIFYCSYLYWHSYYRYHNTGNISSDSEAILDWMPSCKTKSKVILTASQNKGKNVARIQGGCKQTSVSATIRLSCAPDSFAQNITCYFRKKSASTQITLQSCFRHSVENFFVPKIE